jgi:hypothetical protein
MVNPAYRYFVNEVEVYPLNGDKQVFKYERQSPASVVFDLNLDSEFVFKSNGTFDFKAQETSGLCDYLEFAVYQRCSPNDYAVMWEGLFAVSEGKFDNDRCLFSVKPTKKEFILDDLLVNILDVPERVKGSSVTGVVTGLSTAQRIYPNCRWFEDVVLYVAQRSNQNITGLISNFFQINPDGAFPLAGVTNYWDKLAFSSLSDIQEPVPSNEAAIETITFRQLMEDLLALFDVHWFIDDNFKLRVEHSTYFDGVPGLDLTTAVFEKYVRGSNKYSYDLDKIPKQEIWQIQDHKDRVVVTYGGLANLSKNKNARTYNTEVIRTDFAYIRYQGGNSSDDGLFLFATDGGSGSGGTEIRMLEAASQGQNIRLTPYVLMSNLHTYGRPSLYGLIQSLNRFPENNTSGGITLNSVLPLLKQEPISVPVCCTALESQNQIITPLGNGYLDKADYSGKSGMLKLELKYKINNCSDFQPSDLGGMQLWLKYGEGITASSQRVSQWDDASGNGRHATQTGGTDQKPKWAGAGHSVFFLEDASNPSPTEFMHLVTPSFQLFPSKRGTIILLLNNEGIPYVGGSTPAGPLGVISVLSTLDGSPTNVWDLALDASHRYISNWASSLYPTNGVNTYNNWGPTGLYVIRRGSDDKFTCRFNSIECINNPMIIPNQQQVSKPLIIGYNTNWTELGGGFFELSELMIFDRELSITEIEEIELYLVKKGIYSQTYPIPDY